MDTTYNLNMEGYPLFTIMAEDGDGKGKTMAYCFVKNEGKENLEKTLTYFCNINDNGTYHICDQRILRCIWVGGGGWGGGAQSRQHCSHTCIIEKDETLGQELKHITPLD